MAEEAKFNVRLDTRQAIEELKALTNEAQNAASRISDRLGRGMQAIGLGGATFSSVKEAVRGPVSSGVGDVISEAFGGWGAQVQKFLLGDMPAEARATRSAREDAIQAFGYTAGARDKIPAGAKQWFDNVRSIHLDAEKGRTLFERDTDFRSTNPKELLDRLLAGIGKLLQSSVIWLATRLIPV